MKRVSVGQCVDFHFLMIRFSSETFPSEKVNCRYPVLLCLIDHALQVFPNIVQHVIVCPMVPTGGSLSKLKVW